jgi:RNA polymerase sigma-70 factor (ECF subfamily)
VTDLSDAELIESALKGDQGGFATLVDRHSPSVTRMVQRHVRQTEETEDVVQQVFLQAYVHLARFRNEAKFSTWLYSIALNLLRNHVRQRNLRRMDSLDVPGSGQDEPPRQWPDAVISVEDGFQQRWDLDVVRKAAESLAELPYRIFTLHYFQHLTLQEVADRVERPVGTVKVYLHRARKWVLARVDRAAKI